MSEQNIPENVETGVSKDVDAFEEFTVKVNRETNEIVFKNPRTGIETPIKAKVEESPRSERPKPLTIEQFNEAWIKLKQLGISWTTDIPPNPTFREGYERDQTFWKEYVETQKQFLNFPRELGTVVLHTLLHPHAGHDLDKKAEIVRELLTQEYRSEFFFKYAIKVPYFEDIDWEVVIKAHERGVHTMPKIAYALLMLTFRNPVNTTLSVEDAANEYREPEFITVAVNEELIDNLLDKLVTIRSALGQAQKVAESITDQEVTQEESTNGAASTK
jgi:hypothetical protein